MKLSVCAPARPLRDAPRSALRVKQDTPRDLGVGMLKRAGQKPFDGDPYTRLAGAYKATRLIWDKDVFVSRRPVPDSSLQRCFAFPCPGENRSPAVNLFGKRIRSNYPLCRHPVAGQDAVGAREVT
jgi:hypothetical protein